MKIKAIAPLGSDDPQEAAVKRNIQSTLAQEVQDLSMTFRKNQRTYLSSMPARCRGEWRLTPLCRAENARGAGEGLVQHGLGREGAATGRVGACGV